MSWGKRKTEEWHHSDKRRNVTLTKRIALRSQALYPHSFYLSSSNRVGSILSTLLDGGAERFHETRKEQGACCGDVFLSVKGSSVVIDYRQGRFHASILADAPLTLAGKEAYDDFPK